MDAERRSLLLAGAAGLISGCSRPEDAASFDGGWVGAGHERGHAMRDRAPAMSAGMADRRSAGVLVVGAGIAGLACARELVRRGVDDVHVLDLEDAAGGNSRGHRMQGMPCPLGAHYLPVPGPHAGEVAAFLEELGVRRSVGGRVEYDQLHLCHRPQERLHIDGHWREGLLPPVDALPVGERSSTLAQYRLFARRVDEVRRDDAFTIPTMRSRWHPGLDALDQVAFGPWLDAQGLTAPALRWYLDYCCRDDYGACLQEVSAWAGLHYFASRHGFHPPGAEDDDREGVLTWPEGNAWLVEKMARPLAGRLHTGRVAWRVSTGRAGVEVDAWNAREARPERWSAARVVMAVPLFIAVRLLDTPPDALVQAASRMRYAAWQVANVQLGEALEDKPGAPPSWDNVVYGSQGLGYVDAMHQSLRTQPGPTVLSCYRSYGSSAAARKALLGMPWRAAARQTVQEWSAVHPDLPAKVRRVDLMRYGHAMSIPAPGVRSSAALSALAGLRGRLLFAHSDLSAYSVFEEAFMHGIRAADAVKGGSAG